MEEVTLQPGLEEPESTFHAAKEEEHSRQREEPEQRRLERRKDVTFNRPPSHDCGQKDGGRGGGEPRKLSWVGPAS